MGDGNQNSDANGTTIWSSVGTPQYVMTSGTFPADITVYRKFLMSFSIYEDHVQYKAVRLDTGETVYDTRVDRTISQLPLESEPRSRFKFWGGSQESRYYKFWKRQNEVEGTYEVIEYDEPEPPDPEI